MDVDAHGSMTSRRPSPERREVVVIGASAGGVEALIEIVRGLPADLNAAVLAVIHLPATAESELPAILTRNGRLAASHAVDGAPLRIGEIVIAPPNAHLLIDDGTVRLSQGPRENGHRPAVDPLFRSAAEAYRGGVVGVILSGARNDGALGLQRIKAAGGLAVVQENPLHAGMPDSALRSVDVDLVLPLDRIAPCLSELVGSAAEHDSESQGGDLVAEELTPDPGVDNATGLTCPECGGALWQVDEAGLDRFSCHVGHSYSATALLEEQHDQVERAVFAALRALEERAGLLRRLALRFDAVEHPQSHARFLGEAESCEREADVIRERLLGRGSTAAASGEEG